jgi:hypothetical protein
LSVFQPRAFTSTPDENADIACTVNTVISLAPCALARSEGR